MASVFKFHFGWAFGEVSSNNPIRHLAGGFLRAGYVLDRMMVMSELE